MPTDLEFQIMEKDVVVMKQLLKPLVLKSG